MRPRSLSLIVLLLLSSAPTLLFAQAEISSKEEERLAALAREDSEWYAPKNSLTVGFRVLGSGAKVHFGNLGTVNYNTSVAPASYGVGKRTYNDGFVNLDSPRGAELDANGNQTSTPGGRYQVTGFVSTPVTDANGNVIGNISTTAVTGDYVSYTPGVTRVWSYDSPDQALVRPGYIAMNSYSATSDGGTMDKKQGMTGGVELQFGHIMGKLSKRTEWSLVGGVAVNGINTKTAGDVHSTLNTTTDYYSLNGQAAPVTSVTTPYSGPSYTDLVAADGTTTAGGLENTPPVSSIPVNSTPVVQSTQGAAVVHGKWQVKGAYFMVRVGPAVHSQLTERLGLSAGLGVAAAYAGTHYTADESFEIPDVPGTSITTSEYSDENKFLSGYYADINMEWMANDRTGLYGGVSAQKFGDYGQTLAGRTARVDLGTSVGLRGGISIRF